MENEAMNDGDCSVCAWAEDPAWKNSEDTTFRKQVMKGEGGDSVYGGRNKA